MTVLMHSWYYEKKDLKRSPSILDGLDVERESRYRREGARFIINVGTKMGLRYDTMATGVVYFHRFYMFHSFKTFPRYVTACCCLFLAGKVEETPKKCKDIIRIAKSFLADSQFAQFGDDPKEEVMTLERILLQTIKFDLQVDHPYSHLLKYAKSLKGDKTKLHNMVQMAWTFINDSLCTTLCLQWEPEVIAIALMYLAGKLSKFEVVDWNGRTARHSHWWDMFVEGMSIELLEDICHQVLDLYSMPLPITPQDSPPATPPTKSTRKTSQPPSPVEITTSPAQIKPKDPPVGQPIPRLEPGELKRKASQVETIKESVPEVAKAPRITEGKAIPTITSQSPKPSASNLETDTQPTSPLSPVHQESVKNVKEIQKVSSDPIFKSGLTSSNPPAIAQTSSFSHTESNPSKPAPQVAVTSFPVSIPPPTVSYAQTAPPYFSDNQPFPNMQQPPPQIFSQRPPVTFQHPPPLTSSNQPPPPPPPGLHAPPPPQYPPGIPPSGVPPFSSQYPPPPRHQPPPSLLGNPPPIPGIPQHPPPPPPSHPPGLIRNVPPPPGVHPVRHMVPDSLYRPNSDLGYPPDQRGRPPKDRQVQEFLRPPRFDSPFRGRREPEFEPPFPRDPGYRRPPPPNKFGQEFERPPHPGRRFPMDHQQRKSSPSMVNNNPQQQSAAPTGIPPVRITGSQ